LAEVTATAITGGNFQAHPDQAHGDQRVNRKLRDATAPLLQTCAGAVVIVLCGTLRVKLVDSLIFDMHFDSNFAIFDLANAYQ